MAKKATLTDVSSGYRQALTFNDNFDSLNNKFDNTLSLDGSTPNAMTADFDMNSNDILNAKDLSVNGTFLLSGKDVEILLSYINVPETTDSVDYGLITEDITSMADYGSVV